MHRQTDRQTAAVHVLQQARLCEHRAAEPGPLARDSGGSSSLLPARHRHSLCLPNSLLQLANSPSYVCLAKQIFRQVLFIIKAYYF